MTPKPLERCPECGAELEPGQTECPLCGEELLEHKPTAEEFFKEVGGGR